MGGSTATNMSRRTFLGAATVAGVQLAVFGLAGCAPSAQGESGKAGGFTAGTYTGEAEGKFDAVVVETDFTEDSIAAVRVVKSGDTARIEQPAIEKMPERIVDAQGLGVDTVTGSTLTSMAILNAVSSCVEQAGGSVSALKKKGASEPSGEHVDLEADVVVVGAGASGMGGAIAAAQGGKRVIVLEKNSNIGGNCLVSGGYLEYLAAPDDARPAMTPELERYVEDVLGSEIAAQSNPEVVDAQAGVRGIQGIGQREAVRFAELLRPRFRGYDRRGSARRGVSSRGEEHPCAQPVDD